MAAYTRPSRSADAGVIPTCVSVTMANRKLIRHASPALRPQARGAGPVTLAW